MSVPMPARPRAAFPDTPARRAVDTAAANAARCRAAFWLAAVGALGPIALTWVAAIAQLSGAGTAALLEPSGLSPASFVVASVAPSALIHAGAVALSASPASGEDRRRTAAGRHARSAWCMVLASWGVALCTMPWAA